MRKHPNFPWLFLVLAYGFAWLFWIPVARTRQDYQSSPLLLLFLLLGVFGPGLAGIILTYLEKDRNSRKDFWQRMVEPRRIRAKWLVMIVLLWPAFQFLALSLNSLLGGETPEFKFVQDMLAQPLSIPVIIALYFLQAGLEELGWRGYLLERLLPDQGILKSTGIIAIFHAFWHLPMFWVVGTNQMKMGFDLDFLFFVLQVFAFTIFSNWCYVENDHSTLAVTLLHTTVNLCLDIFTVIPGTLKYYLYTLLMVAGAVGLVVVGLAQSREHKNEVKT